MVGRNNKRTDDASNFSDLAYNAIIRHSSKSNLEGNLVEKLKKNPDFKAWRKKILALYKSNPQIKRFQSQAISFGGNDFFSMKGDTELKLAIGHAYINATLVETKGSIVINYSMEDSFDLDYQKGRSDVYNGINGFLKPIWEYKLGGNPSMQIDANWSETIKK